MLFHFPIPNIFHIGENLRQSYESRYERPVARDFRNSVLLEPLETGLMNLEDIRVRIGSRIDKEVSAGKDMSKAIDLLETADQILSLASKAVAIATSTVSNNNLQPAYRESQTAYIALSQARQSLTMVVDMISTLTGDNNVETTK